MHREFITANYDQTGLLIPTEHMDISHYSQANGNRNLDYTDHLANKSGKSLSCFHPSLPFPPEIPRADESSPSYKDQNRK